MKRTFFTILLLCGLPIASFSQRGILLGLPYDDPNARRDVYGQIELKPFIAEYNQIIERRIGPLKDSDIANVFGPKLAQRGFTTWYPTNCVAPLFVPYSLLFSGLLEGEDKAHRDLYAVGNIGYLEFFYERDGRFKTVVYYACLNDKFVPLKSPSDFPNRLEWDKTRFEEFKKWLDAHLDPNEAVKPRSPNMMNDSTK
jgi:hypothetical protein